MNKNILPYILSCFIFFTGAGVTAQPDRPEGVDSVLYSYFMKCAVKNKSYEVMALSDTLFDLAGEKNNRRMQAAALSYKTDYYYYKGDKDSMLYYMKECQDFSRQYDQFTHYYFVWYKLISYYNNRKQFNLALAEINKMLEQAKKDSYKDGILKSYVLTADIYFLQNMNDIAIKYYKQAIQYMKENDIKDYNIHVSYSSLAKALTSNGKYDEALKVLAEAEKNLSNQRYRSNVNYGYFNTYLKMGETAKARAYLDDIKGKFERGEDLALSEKEILNAEKAYAEVTGDWQRVLELTDEVSRLYKDVGIDSTVRIWDLRDKGEAYYNLGNMAEAGKYFRRFIKEYVESKEAEAKSRLNEFSIMLEVDRLAAENKELEINSQKEKIRYNRMLILVLSCLLTLGIIFILFVTNMNRKLSKSNRVIEKKNRKLMISQHALSAAKEKAEKANEVKTMFLQNITHEIRTPLNAIVGFSDLLASHIQDHDGEAKEYSDIIHKNSDHLLSLIDSVLYISDLEFSDITGVKVEMGVDICCRDCIERVRPSVKDGVDIMFIDRHGHDLVLNAYFGYISEVLVRLLDNAAKFTEEGRIELSYDVSQDGKFVVFSVTDTGMGIREGIEEKIFEMFAKGNMFMPGIGLGLSITRIIAEKLGGSITLDREYKEKGSRFLFSIPI